MDGKSLNTVKSKIEELKAIFPEAVTEGKVDWEKLQATLGKENAEFRNERYVLNWAGKSEAFKVLQQSTTATLKPVPGESINFDSTENVFIEGENLEVLKVLQKAYYGKIKVIVIDPPYNTGNDSFIYPDSFKESREEYQKRIGERDEEGYLMKEGFFRKNSKDSGHYHSNWLSMMYPRLFLAKNLLRDDGVIFVHIDDNEVHNLRLIMNEIFGEENFVAQFTIINNLKGRNDKKNVATAHEYLIAYAKREFNSYGLPLTDDQKKEFKYVDEKGEKYALRDLRKRGRPDRREDRPNMFFPIFFNKITKKCSLYRISDEDIEIIPKRGDNTEGRWRWGLDKVKDNLGILHPKYSPAKNRWDIEHRVYLNNFNGFNEEEEDYFEEDEIETIDEKTSKPKSFLIGGEISTDVGRRNFKTLFPEIDFDYPKAVEFIKKIVFYSSKNDELILDFFAGSATTAQAVIELNKEDGGNRKFILIQLPELCDEESEAYKAGYKTIADIGKERIRRVINKIEKEKTEKPELFEKGELDLGFKVFKLSSSNFKIWRGSEITEENLESQLDAFTNPVKEGSETENMLYEIILKAGYLLTDNVDKKDKYYSIKAGELIIALEEIAQKLIDKIITAKPKKVITLDKLFTGNDQLKTNTVLQMKDAEIDFKTI